MASSILDNLERGKSKQQYLGPINYHGHEIAQYFSPNNIINDIVTENNGKNLTSILIIGTPGSGKTTVSCFLAHGIHTEAWRRYGRIYNVLHYSKDDLLNFKEIIRNIPEGHCILRFSDVTAALKMVKDVKQKAEILETLTTARHPEIGPDRNVIIISDLHYLLSMEKTWRSQGAWKVYTDLQNEELQNFNNITDYDYQAAAKKFSHISVNQFRHDETFTISLTNKQEKTYHRDKPFRLQMILDNNNLRFMLSIKATCGWCKPPDKSVKPLLPTAPLFSAIDQKERARDYRQALKMLCFMKGIRYGLRKNVRYAYDDLMKLTSMYDVNYEEIALRLAHGTNDNTMLTKEYRNRSAQPKFIAAVLKEANLDYTQNITPDYPDRKLLSRMEKYKLLSQDIAKT